MSNSTFTDQAVSAVTALDGLVGTQAAAITSATSQISDLQNTIASQQVQIASDTTTITGLQTQVTQAQSDLSSAQSKLSVTSASLAGEVTRSKVVAEAILRGFSTGAITSIQGIEAMSGWRLAGGTVGNTGATGSGGTGAVTLNSDGTVSFSIAPKGPYYDAYFYRDFPTASLPPLSARIFYHRVDYLMDANAFSVRQALENEMKVWDGKFVYDLAWQGEKSWRYFHYTGSAGTGKWVDAGIPTTFAPWTTKAMHGLFVIDPVNGYKTHVGLLVDDVYHHVGFTEPAVTSTAAPRVLTSVQLDSNKNAAPYSVTIKNAAGWL